MRQGLKRNLFELKWHREIEKANGNRRENFQNVIFRIERFEN